ncbi:hypothetical protein SGM_4747 [Streptomyces griseoaurantiacus M045]|uniref:Uncharacterized protein n=1 Tax=Streptomyces griseoaurantiacus M045 TaxID=996637 RepID=F3NNN3_9ACTN|nr:hypothetical protein SGM_4747 [Streptomyces griseoaurantiacus M045]
MTEAGGPWDHRGVDGTAAPGNPTARPDVDTSDGGCRRHLIPTT